MEVELELKTQH